MNGRWQWVEVSLALLLGAGAGLATFRGAQRIPEAMLLSDRGYDVWFEGDLPRVFANMSTRWPEPKYHKHHTRRHPLFIPATLPFVKACQMLLGLSPVAAVRLVLAAAAGVWMAALFGLLRLMGRARLDALTFSVLGAVSAAAVFWCPVPETWLFGSVTILAALLLVAASQRRPIPLPAIVVVSALTLSITVTNWMAGLIAAAATLPWRRALRATALAFLLVLALWGLQKLALPNVQSFLRIRSASGEMFAGRSVGPGAIAAAFAVHAMVMPAIAETSSGRRPWPRMTVQGARPGSAGRWGQAAVALWLALLAVGGWEALRDRGNRRVLAVVGLTLLGQFLLHLCYGGEEVFLYTLHWLPLLLVVAACGAASRARPAVLAAAVSLALCAGINNLRQFDAAITYLERSVPVAPAPMELRDASP